jgi:hypothetical protein
MNTFTTSTFSRAFLAFLAFCLVFAWGTVAVHADEAGSSLSIAPSGQIIVKGARVVSVYGSTIVAETGWGAAKLSFAVQTSGSTRFVPELSSAQALAAIRPGHSISFSGELSGSLARPTVLATVVKDTELVQESVAMNGKVKSVDVGNSTFVLVGTGGDVTVHVPSSALMSRNGNHAEIADVQIGDSARVQGVLDSRSGVLTASRASLVIEKNETPDVAQEPKEGILSALIGWLRGSRGILSVRDR